MPGAMNAPILLSVSLLAAASVAAQQATLALTARTPVSTLTCQ